MAPSLPLKKAHRMFDDNAQKWMQTITVEFDIEAGNAMLLAAAIKAGVLGKEMEMQEVQLSEMLSEHGKDKLLAVADAIIIKTMEAMKDE